MSLGNGKRWCVLCFTSKCCQSSENCRRNAEKLILHLKQLIFLLFCKTRRVGLVHMPQEGVVRITQIRSTFFYQYAKLLLHMKCDLWLGSIWTAACTSPSHSMIYTRLVLTGVPEIKGGTTACQMHWSSSSASRNIFQTSFHSFHLFVTGDRFLLSLLRAWACPAAGHGVR